MANIERFEDIESWKTARELTRRIYEISNRGKFAHDYGLRDQLRRAAVSIMSNIAEGFESRTPALFLDYLGRAKASAGEVRAQLYVALDVDYINQEEFAALAGLAESCSRLLSRFIAYLESKPSNRIREASVSYELDG